MRLRLISKLHHYQLKGSCPWSRPVGFRVISAQPVRFAATETDKNPPTSAPGADVERVEVGKTVRLLLGTDVVDSLTISGEAAAISANIIVPERLNRTATERSAGRNIVRNGDVTYSRD